MRVSLPIRTLLPLPSLPSTRPTAQPSLSMNSALIGASPTLPRMPSVPKYFFCTACSLWALFDGFIYFERLDRSAHVVHSDQQRAPADGQYCSGQTAVEALIHRAV